MLYKMIFNNKLFKESSDLFEVSSLARGRGCEQLKLSIHVSMSQKKINKMISSEEFISLFTYVYILSTNYETFTSY